MGQGSSRSGVRDFCRRAGSSIFRVLADSSPQDHDHSVGCTEPETFDDLACTGSARRRQLDGREAAYFAGSSAGGGASAGAGAGGASFLAQPVTNMATTTLSKAKNFFIDETPTKRGIVFASKPHL